MPSLADRLDAALDITSGASRFVDLCLVFRRRSTGEILLWAGGRWDTLLGRFVDDEPAYAKVIDLEESQVEVARWFAEYMAALREGRPRDISLALAGGDRRGGKTFVLLLCALALLVDVPSLGGSTTIGWVVSSNYQERDEIDQIIRENIPADWYVPRRAPHYSYALVHGPSLKNISADDPETLKRGRVDIAFYNEAQKIAIAALSNGSHTIAPVRKSTAVQ